MIYRYLTVVDDRIQDSGQEDEGELATLPLEFENLP